MLGAVVLGYIVMSRIDRFVGSGGIFDSPQGRSNKGALVYGSPDVAGKLQQCGILCSTLSGLTFPEDGLYSALFALSADDGANLTLCSAAKTADPGIYIIVRCNDQRLHDAFKAAGADRILGAAEPIDLLMAELGGVGK